MPRSLVTAGVFDCSIRVFASCIDIAHVLAVLETVLLVSHSNGRYLALIYIIILASYNVDIGILHTLGNQCH